MCSPEGRSSDQIEHWEAIAGGMGEEGSILTLILRFVGLNLLGSRVVGPGRAVVGGCAVEDGVRDVGHVGVHEDGGPLDGLLVGVDAGVEGLLLRFWKRMGK